MRDIKKEIQDIKNKIQTIEADPDIWYEYPYIKDNYFKQTCIDKYGKCYFNIIKEEHALYNKLNKVQHKINKENESKDI
tara:strand:+ start:372 stop:608 length:237 start_codon:yes stop_codon:yes gene_type:complete